MLLRCCGYFLLAALCLHGQRGGGRGGAVLPEGQAAALPGQAAGPSAPADCAASGTVVNALTGEPIPRAMVTLGGADAGSATDATGQWSITKTTCGARVASATRAGFIASNGFQATLSSRQRLQLVSGSPVTNVKIELMPEASIAGKVQDADGDPLESVQIQVLRVAVQNGKRVLTGAGNASIDAEGNFRIGRLAAGHFIVCAMARQLAYPVGGGPALVYIDDCFPGPPSSGPSIAMAVDAGREVRATLTLRAVRGLYVRGSVSGLPAAVPGPGRGGARATVQLWKFEAGGGGLNRSAPVTQDGTFDIGPVAPGSYILRANLQAQQPREGAPSAEEAVTVGDSDVNDVNLALQQPGSIAGAVRFEWSSPDSAPAVNPVVNVNITPETPGMGIAGPIPRAEWDASHINFSFAGVPAAQFRFIANVNSQAAYVKSASYRG